MFLFVLGLIIVKGRERWWLLAAIILSITLAWGKNFMFLTDLFIDYLPGYNKFRAVTTILVIAIFAIPFLGILALRNIFSGLTPKNEILKGIKIAAGITGGLSLLFVIFPQLAGTYISPVELSIDLPDWLTSALVADRQKLLRSDAFRSFLLILASASIIWAFVHEKFKKEYAIICIAILFIGDMWSVNKRYLDTDRFVRNEAKIPTPTPADLHILRDTAHFRTLNISVSTFNDALTSYFHKSIGGYHGAKLKRYQELIERSLSPDIAHIMQTASSAQTFEELEASFDNSFNNTPGLNMLNAKYVIYNPDAEPIENEKAMGNAWFAEKPLLVENADEEIAAINNADLSSEAIIDKRFGALVTKSSYPHSDGDTIITTSYRSNEIVYSVQSSSEKLAVFSEIYYPAGWKSYIDGIETPHFRANYVLRAMIIPAGNHEIVFKFAPESYRFGNRVAYASSDIFIILLVGQTILTIRKRRKSV